MLALEWGAHRPRRVLLFKPRLEIPRLYTEISNYKRGRALLTEILLPRIARRGTVCLLSTRG